MAAKVIAFLLMLVMTAVTAGGVLGAVFLYSTDVYVTSETAFKQELFSNIAWGDGQTLLNFLIWNSEEQVYQMNTEAADSYCAERNISYVMVQDKTGRELWYTGLAEYDSPWQFRFSYDWANPERPSAGVVENAYTVRITVPLSSVFVYDDDYALANRLAELAYALPLLDLRHHRCCGAAGGSLLHLPAVCRRAPSLTWTASVPAGDTDPTGPSDGGGGTGAVLGHPTGGGGQLWRHWRGAGCGTGSCRPGGRLYRLVHVPGPAAQTGWLVEEYGGLCGPPLAPPWRRGGPSGPGQRPPGRSAWAGGTASQRPLVGKTVLVFLGLCVLEGLGILFSMFAWSWGLLALLWIFEKLLLLLAVLALALMCRKLLLGGRALAAGDLSYQVDTSRMVLDFKSHGEDLNHIAQGMAAAVDQRMRSERMKTELITNVSHDIKTPLTSIINYADLIGKEPPNSEKIPEYAAVLTRQSERLKRLIEDLVEASKASTGNLEVNLAPLPAWRAADPGGRGVRTEAEGRGPGPGNPATGDSGDHPGGRPTAVAGVRQPDEQHL